MDESGRLAAETGFTDWTKISPEEVRERTGLRVPAPAGFSRRAASFHPAKWVWSLFRVALASGCDELGVQGPELAEVGRYDGALLCPRKRDDIGIRQRLPLVSLLDRNGVVPAGAQFGRDERREHLVEQELQRLMASCPASQAACSDSLSRALSSIHSSISSGYAP